MVLLGLPGVARAGMPSVTLTDLARMRVQTLSFFLLVLLLGAVAIRWAWNALRADFPRLPRLSYSRALGVMTLWGLLFLLVLTMISGARELMTPGAWTKADGALTYVLVEPPAGTTDTTAPSPDDRARRLALERLRALLWSYAEAHEGRFPADREAPAIPESAWRVPDPSGMRYVYNSGLAPEDHGPGRPLAIEPDLFDGPRLVLLSDGAIRPVTSDELGRAPARDGGRP